MSASQQREPASSASTKRKHDLLRNDEVLDTARKTRKRQKHHRSAILSLLPTMPLDILYEIFGFLPPRTLLLVAETNKAFRQMLLDASATIVWKTARIRFRSLPPPYPGFTELSWMRRVFGSAPYFCHHCRTIKRSPWTTFYFEFTRRLCKPCIRAWTVDETSFRRRFPAHNPIIMDLVPFALLNGAFKVYWVPDIHSIASRLGTYQTSVAMGNPGADQALEDFKNRSQALVIDYRHAYSGYVTLDDLVQVNLARERQENADAFYEGVETRLKKLAYKSKDIETLKETHQSVVTRWDKPLTEKLWKTAIYPTVERAVFQARGQRLIRDHGDVLSARRKTLSESLQTYKRKLCANDWIYLPGVHVISRMEPVVRVFWTDEEIDIGWQNLAPVLPTLWQEIRDWKQTVLSKLRQLSIEALGTDKLDLAIVIFDYKASPRAFLTVEDVFRFLHGEGIVVLDDFRFDIVVSRVAARLARDVGLDPSTATEEDMEKASSVLFECRNSDCAWSTKSISYILNSVKSCTLMSWRGCLAHVFHKRDKTFLCTRFSPRSQSDAPLTWTFYEDASGILDLWSCNRCAEHLDQWAPLEDVRQHLRTRHCIENPHERVDYIYCPEREYPVSYTVGRVEERYGYGRALA